MSTTIYEASGLRLVTVQGCTPDAVCLTLEVGALKLAGSISLRAVPSGFELAYAESGPWLFVPAAHFAPMLIAALAHV